MLYCYWELLCWLNSIFPNFYFSCKFSSLKARDGRKKQVLTEKKWTDIAWLGSTVQPLCIRSNQNQYVYTHIYLLPIRSERCRWCIWCMNEELLFSFSHITYEKLNIILPQSFFLLHILFLLSEIIFLYGHPLKSLFQKPKENWVHLCIISLAIFASIPNVLSMHLSFSACCQGENLCPGFLQESASTRRETISFYSGSGQLTVSIPDNSVCSWMPETSPHLRCTTTQTQHK